MHKLSLCFISLMIGLSGCVLVRSEHSGSLKGLEPSRTEKIALLSSRPERPFKEIGQIKIQTTNTTHELIIKEQLARAARDLGADAVIDIETIDEEIKRPKEEKSILDNKVIKRLHRHYITATAIIYTQE